MGGGGVPILGLPFYQNNIPLEIIDWTFLNFPLAMCVPLRNSIECFIPCFERAMFPCEDFLLSFSRKWTGEIEHSPHHPAVWCKQMKIEMLKWFSTWQVSSKVRRLSSLLSFICLILLSRILITSPPKIIHQSIWGHLIIEVALRVAGRAGGVSDPEEGFCDRRSKWSRALVVPSCELLLHEEDKCRKLREEMEFSCRGWEGRVGHLEKPV